MMVYVLMEYLDEDGSTLHGAYSSVEAAIAKHPGKWNIREDGYAFKFVGNDLFDLEPIELDA